MEPAQSMGSAQSMELAQAMAPAQGMASAQATEAAKAMELMQVIHGGGEGHPVGAVHGVGVVGRKPPGRRSLTQRLPFHPKASGSGASIGIRAHKWDFAEIVRRSPMIFGARQSAMPGGSGAHFEDVSRTCEFQRAVAHPHPLLADPPSRTAITVSATMPLWLLARPPTGARSPARRSPPWGKP